MTISPLYDRSGTFNNLIKMSIPPMDSEAFLDLPALPPPPGITPNFVNPPNLRAPAWSALQLVLATIAVAVRLYTKRFIVRRMLAEDCTSRILEWQA